MYQIKISTCLLTFNSDRTLNLCLESLLQVSDELIVIDSGSTDKTIEILKKYNIEPIQHQYETHAKQMNFAISQASNEWVLCMDSDEILDLITIENINNLKTTPLDPSIAYRISRYWHILGGKPVRNIYPVSSPDFPVRVFNKTTTKFNDAPVDDKPIGFQSTKVLNGYVYHDTFYSLHELFNKLNSYTTRLTNFKKISPSLIKAFLHPIIAFIKWYFLKKSYKDGKIGFICSLYAALYTFLKYLKAWYKTTVEN